MGEPTDTQRGLSGATENGSTFSWRKSFRGLSESVTEQQASHQLQSLQDPDSIIRQVQIDDAQPDDEDGARHAEESRRDPTGLSRTLGERHVNMIAFSSVIGVGIFLENGRVINLAGPGMAFLAYPLMGTIICSTQAALGEMTALFPTMGALFQLPCRFLDLSIGYAAGWMSWFSWVVINAAELNGIALLFKFQFNPDDLARLHYPEPTLEWSPTLMVSPAVWVTLFWIATLLINRLRVHWYGEIEYWIGVLKIFFLVGLILFNVIINAQSGTYFLFYQDPWGFVTQSFTASTGNVYTGGTAQLAGVWSALTSTIFSLNGMEAVAITAAEKRNYRAQDGVKISTRKVAIRIIILYTLSTFVVGLNVPYDDPVLADSSVAAVTSGSHSAFVLAAVRAGKTFWPKFFNGFFIFSGTSSSLSSLYLASRLLHAMAVSPEAWPPWSFVQTFRLWLAETGSKGVPNNAVFVSWLFGTLGYLAAGVAPTQVLGRMATNSVVSMLIVYAVISVTFIKFKAIIHEVASGNIRVDRRQDVGAYSRAKGNPTYPYRTHWQPLRSYYAFLGCMIMATFNGWQVFSPFSAGDFLASYISVFVFLVLCLAYRFSLHGGAALQWRLFPTMNLDYPVILDRADPSYGRYKLTFTNKDGLRRRIERTIDWIWIWLK